MHHLRCVAASGSVDEKSHRIKGARSGSRRRHLHSHDMPLCAAGPSLCVYSIVPQRTVFVLLHGPGTCRRVHDSLEAHKVPPGPEPRSRRTFERGRA